MTNTTTQRPQPPVVVDTLELIVCCVCGMWFAAPPVWVAKRRERGDDFWCPAGHRLHYGEGDIERLRRQLTQAERARTVAWEAEEAARRAHAITKGKLTKARRRTAHGVCPVSGCSRAPFPNLARHMATQHPDFVADADHDAGVQVLADGPYGTMRKRPRQGSGPAWYDCAGGHTITTAAGRAAEHARTCPAARQPWSTTPTGA